jgi:hypothetical protein
MRTPDELLRENGISLDDVSPGRHYTTCPQCSSKRKHGHQRLECLGVTIEANGRVHWGCNHCDFKGPEKKPNGHDGAAGKWVPQGEWIYQDENGVPYLRVRRYLTPDGKSYPQSHWDGDQWVKGKPDGPKIPYRLPELLDSDRTEPVFIAEGEKCVERLRKESLQATCASEGAGKWTSDLNEHFRGRIVWSVPDNDEPGRKHAQDVARNLHNIAREVKIVDLSPFLKNREDVVEFFDVSGETANTLMKLGEEAPIWKPPEGYTRKTRTAP